MGTPDATYEILKNGRAIWRTNDGSGQFTTRPVEEEIKKELVEKGLHVDPNLVVNIANLGVSLYNAYQLRQVRKQLDVVGKGVERTQKDLAALRSFSEEQFKSMHGLLDQQRQLLGTLLEGQQSIVQQLEVVRREMSAGFAATQRAIVDADARRIADELGARASALLRTQKHLVDAVNSGIDVVAEARRVVDAATDLLGWLDTQLHRHAAGEPARLPLLMSKAAALHFLLDARRFAGSASEGIDRERSEFADEIAREAFAVADKRTIYALSTTHAELLSAYVFLFRVFTTAVEIVVDEGGTIEQLFPVGHFQWNDHLAAVRGALNGERPSATAPGDRDWLDAFRRENRSPRELLDVLGVPAVKNVEIENLLALRPFIDAKGRNEVGKHLQREFGWQRAPSVVTVDSLAPVEVVE